MTKFILNPKFGIVIKKIVDVMRPWPWCLIGGRAVEVWINPPQTPDVDVLAVIEDEDVPEITKRFERVGVIPKEVYEGIAVPLMFFKDVKQRVEVDVLGAYDQYHPLVVARAVTKTVQGIRFPVAYAEDIVALKAQVSMDPKRPADHRARDRKAIIDINNSCDLNKPLMRKTLEMYGMTEELKRLQFMRIL